MLYKKQVRVKTMYTRDLFLSWFIITITEIVRYIEHHRKERIDVSRYDRYTSFDCDRFNPSILLLVSPTPSPSLNISPSTFGHLTFQLRINPTCTLLFHNNRTVAGMITIVYMVYHAMAVTLRRISHRLNNRLKKFVDIHLLTQNF